MDRTRAAARRRRTGLAAAALVALAAAVAPGCASMSRAEQGMLLGGLAGAGIGRAVGHHNGNEARGGFAGAALGAVIGGLAGALSDSRATERHTVAPVDLHRDPHRCDDADAEFLPPIPPPRVVRRTRTTVRYEVVEPCREVVIVEECR